MTAPSDRKEDFVAKHFGDYWVISVTCGDRPRDYAIRIADGELRPLPNDTLPFVVFHGFDTQQPQQAEGAVAYVGQDRAVIFYDHVYDAEIPPGTELFTKQGLAGARVPLLASIRTWKQRLEGLDRPTDFAEAQAAKQECADLHALIRQLTKTVPDAWWLDENGEDARGPAGYFGGECPVVTVAHVERMLASLGQQPAQGDGLSMLLVKWERTPYQQMDYGTAVAEIRKALSAQAGGNGND